MDAIDRRIIRELQADGRLTNQELSERVHLSPSPCLRRVRNLERRGVIRGYTAIVDQEAYGLPINVFLSVRLEKQTQSAIDVFEAGVQDLDEVLACYTVTGSNDYLLHVVTDSLKSYETFVKQKLTRIPGIGTIESAFTFGTVKQKTTFPQLASFTSSSPRRRSRS
jgi:Lrp/AsnC family leucine-responsive transcriptional regulator